jgi:hypothetical protein
MAEEAKAHLLLLCPGVNDERYGAEYCSGGPTFRAYHAVVVAAETNSLPVVWHIHVSLSFFHVSLD